MKQSILRNNPFLFMWLGNGISELGGAFGTFCNSIIVYELTGSALALGSMWLLYFIPSLLLQLVIGPFIDKWSRKWIMIICQWTRGLVFFIPLVMLFVGNIEVWHVYVVQMVVGVITPFYVPANQAITPTIVPREQLQSANAYIDGMVRLMTFTAPVVGGIVIEYFGVSATLLLVCLLLCLSGFMLLFIEENRTPRSIRTTWLTQFKEGMTYFVKQPVIMWLGIFLAFVQFGVGVTMVINLPYIIDELKGNFSLYGYFIAGFPLGFVVGAFMVGKVTYNNRRLLMLGSLVIGGLTYISLGLNYSIAFAIITEIIAGIAMAFFSIHNTTICQKTVPNHLMGNVFSVRLFITRAAMPLGVLIGGILSELWGVRQLFVFIGTIICVVSLTGILLPSFRFLNSPVANEKINKHLER